MGNDMIMNSKDIHIILKWNEAAIFHSDAPDTILEHCQILHNYPSPEKYVWWGKISVSGYLGMNNEDVCLLNTQIKNGKQTYIFLYCPDKSVATMHVGKLDEITTKDMAFDDHTPAYYRDLRKKYTIPFWFKMSDITEIPFSSTLDNLLYLDGRAFDPVSVNFYPQKILMKIYIDYFIHHDLYEHILEGKMKKCFKTGGICTRKNEPELIFKPNQVFIGCPFQQKFFNFVNHVIKPACNELGYDYWFANEQFMNIDIMCKVCGGIQSSGKAIIDLTGWNANVLFELGLLYGLEKSVLLIKHTEEDVPADVKGIEYVFYDMNNFDEAKKIIKQYLKGVV